MKRKFSTPPSSESLRIAKALTRKSSWKHRKKKSVCSKRSALNEKASWKFQKKKLVLTRRSSLNEITLWKRRKKKRSLYKFVPGTKSSPLKSDHAWKRRMKWQRSGKWLFFVFDWNPGIASLLTRPAKSSFFFRRKCADAGNNITTLISFTVKCNADWYVNALYSAVVT